MGLYEKIKEALGKPHGDYVLSRGENMVTRQRGIRDMVRIADGIYSKPRIKGYKLWDTWIVLYDIVKDAVILDTGGYFTKTTKEKMNTCLSLLGLDLWVEGKIETRRSEAGPWYVVRKDGTKEAFDEIGGRAWGGQGHRI